MTTLKGVTAENMPQIVEGTSFNFISKAVAADPKVQDLFFGPMDGTDKFIIMEENWTMAHILHAAGVFPSIGQAKKQGGNQEIPRGFSMVTRGKKMRRKNLFVLNL